MSPVKYSEPKIEKLQSKKNNTEQDILVRHKSQIFEVATPYMSGNSTP